MEDCLIYGNFGSVEFSGNIQGDGGHFGPQISSESANMVMKPIFATTKKVTLVTVCKWVSPQYTIYSFADSTREACTVTQKLDLDQMSARSIRTLKDTNILKLTFCCKCLVYLFV